jgi:hypothetical protein
VSRLRAFGLSPARPRIRPDAGTARAEPRFPANGRMGCEGGHARCRNIVVHRRGEERRGRHRALPAPPVQTTESEAAVPIRPRRPAKRPGPGPPRGRCAPGPSVRYFRPPLGASFAPPKSARLRPPLHGITTPPATGPYGFCSGKRGRGGRTAGARTGGRDTGRERASQGKAGGGLERAHSTVTV